MEEAIVNREACLGSSPTPDQRTKYHYTRDLTLRSTEKAQELYNILKPFLQVTIALESNKAKLSRLFSWYTWLQQGQCRIYYHARKLFGSLTIDSIRCTRP